MSGGAGSGLGAPSSLPLFFILLLSAAAVASAAQLGHGGSETLIVDRKDRCNYTVIVETTCSKGAGTSDHVSLRFGDSTSNDILVRHLGTQHVDRVDGFEPAILDDVPRKPFQQCATNAFRVTGKCIQSKICYLYLKQRGDDDWRPGRVQVFVPMAPELSSGLFYFRRFLPRRVWHGFDACIGEVTPFGVRRARKVFAHRHGLMSP